MINTDKDTIQEWILVLGDRFSQVPKFLWALLAIIVVASIPGYFVLTSFFLGVANSQYHPPVVTPSTEAREPLQVLDQKIFALSGNVYSGYVKIRNINLDWGVAKQDYSLNLKTEAGTLITQVNGSAYILPSSDKLIVFSRFTADRKPEISDFKLGVTKFIHPPKVAFEHTLERTNLQNPPSGMTVSSGIKNLSPFTIRRVDLPVTVYDSQNKIVAVSFYNIQDLKPNETRTFQYLPWPTGVAGAIRAEINPQINIFDPDIFQVSNTPVDNTMQ